MIKEEKNKKKLIPLLVYGSLRPGQYNFDRFFGKLSKNRIDNPETEVDFICSVILSGYKMYTIGKAPYPVVIYGKPEDEIECDLLLIDENSYNNIRLMEEEAGYNEDKVDVKFEESKNSFEANVFVYGDSINLDKYQRIESGNWNQYVAENSKAEVN